VNAAASALYALWGTSWRARGVLEFLAQDDAQLLRSGTADAAVLDWFEPSYRPVASTGLAELEECRREHDRLSFPASAMEDSANAYLPEQVLVKVDRASMRSALDCRAPFLNRALFEYVWSMPQNYHSERGVGKALLRNALPNLHNSCC